VGGGIAMLMDVLGGRGASEEHKVIHSSIHSFIYWELWALKKANPLRKSVLLVNVSFFPHGY
jgi:hypothetical protein